MLSLTFLAVMFSFNLKLTSGGGVPCGFGGSEGLVFGAKQQVEHLHYNMTQDMPVHITYQMTPPLL